MRRSVSFSLGGKAILAILFLAGCDTMPEGIQQAKVAVANRIASGL
jgi:starvation-inducible outer membrane lipoprotein